MHPFFMVYVIPSCVIYEVVVKTKHSPVLFLPHQSPRICAHTSSCPTCIRITNPCCMASDFALAPVRVKGYSFPLSEVGCDLVTSFDQWKVGRSEEILVLS